MLSAALLERWPQVCRVEITFTKLPTNRCVSTTKLSVKYVENWIPLRIRIRSRNTQPHLNFQERSTWRSWFTTPLNIPPVSVLTPVAGPIFETKNRAIFLERFFGRGISGEALLPLQLGSHQLAVEWIHFPRIRTFVEKRFHGLFSKKKHSISGGVPSFPRREHVPAVISLPRSTFLKGIKMTLRWT